MTEALADRTPVVEFRRPARLRWALSVAAAVVAVAVLAGVAGYAIAPDTNGGSDRAGWLVEAAARGTLLVSRTGGGGGLTATFVSAAGEHEGFVWVEGLPELTAGKDYQSWFTRAGSSFEPSAVFKASTGGVWLDARSAVDEYAAIGFTIEDDGGADAPSQAPFVVIELSRSARRR